MATTTMTKNQLGSFLAEEMGAPITKKIAMLFLDELAEIALKETKKNGVFVLPGLGRLVKAHRKARVGRNPQTGESIQIKAKTVVKFRVSKAVKDLLAGTAGFAKTKSPGDPRGLRAEKKKRGWEKALPHYAMS